MGTQESIRELVEPLVTASGLELWDIEVASGLVRILVDRPGGIDLDALGELTERISAALDGHDEMTPRGHYSLEVSSPGVERKLRTPDQFRRYVGTLVSVKTAEPIDGSRRTRGVLVGVDDAGITVEAAHLQYEQIQSAHTVLEWGPAPKPGKTKAATTR
jgi:ribosome maturation factor RimP